jgi:isochorismate synthase
MERVFVDSADPCDVADSWSAYFDRLQVRTILEQASVHAAQTGKATPASLVLPLPKSDPLRVFRAFQQLHAGECFYWEQPSRHMALVGAGTALSFQSDGSGRFADAALAWQQLRNEAMIQYASDFPADSIASDHGPVLFGGFSFDPLRPRTFLWRNFPDGLLILPRLLFTLREDQASLTCNWLIKANDNLDNLTNSMSRQLTRLVELIKVFPGSPESMPVEDHAYDLYDVWPAETWKALVSETVRQIQQGRYAKVVLAREAQVAANGRSFSLAATLRQLRQSYPGSNVFAFQRGKQTFVGATPERLVRAQDGKLHTMALAGSAPRGTTEEEDRRLGSELLQSAKNREEHEIVMTTICDALDHLCSRTWVADTPELLRLKNIQHLQTAIVGELLPDRSLLEALHALHPTPAVGGAPTEPALAFIREHENLDRGWYAGPIGWVDLRGNGEFAVALRSALLEERLATLFAGCGIVRDSDPEAEYTESCLKLQVILRSLSGEEQ